MKQYCQCLLRQGTIETVGWIEARGATVGNVVEILGGMSLTHDVRNQVDLGDYWEVVEVYSSLPEDVLKHHQLMNRNSLPSVEGMGK